MINTSKQIFALALGCALCPSLAFAQGTITDGTASYNLASVPTSTTSLNGTGNFTVGGGADSLYQSWWYYRTAGGSGGAFNNAGVQFTQTYLGNLATLSWSDVDALGIFDANLTMVVQQTGPTNAVLSQVMVLTNRTASPQTLSLFHYVDFDVNATCCGTTGDWTLPGSGLGRFVVTDASGTCVEHWGSNPTNYEVGAFAGVRTKCVNGTPLSDIGLPFAAPGAGLDYTGAMEWRSVTLPPLSSLTFTTAIGNNDLFSGNAASSTNYGTGLAPSGGTVPTISSTAPLLGQPLTVTVGTSSSSPSAVLLIGFSSANSPVCGITLWMNPTLDTTIAMTAGTGSFTLPALCNPTLAGLDAYWQGFIVDAGSPSTCFPLIHTPGLNTRFGD